MPWMPPQEASYSGGGLWEALAAQIWVFLVHASCCMPHMPHVPHVPHGPTPRPGPLCMQVLDRWLHAKVPMGSTISPCTCPLHAPPLLPCCPRMLPPCSRSQHALQVT